MKYMKEFILVILISIVAYLLYLHKEQRDTISILVTSHRQLEEWLNEEKKEAI